MQLNSTIGWKGRVKIIINGPCPGVIEMDNLITNDGLAALAGALKGDASQIRYMAWGDDDGTILPLANDNTTLGNEIGRKMITKQTAVSPGVMTSLIYLAPYEANTTIKEFGWFSGTGDISGKDQGTLIARVLLIPDHTKTELESIDVERTDTISRV